jgi:hypothetical protein
LVLNGLSNINSGKHTIEDHFLKTASETNLVTLPERIDDPKEHWQNKVDAATQEAVYKQLAATKKLIEQSFPQQTEGLALLKGIGLQ